MNKILFAAVIALFAVTTVYSQSSAQTVEEVYLSTSLEVSIIAELAVADTREQKLAALDILEQMLKDGKLKEGDPQVNNILASLSSEGTSIVVRENRRKVNYYPDVRRRAAKLLGELGGENAKRTLIEITITDDEPMVLSQAVYALGILGLNDRNDSLLAISRVIDNDSKKAVVDDNLAVASLLAIEKIAVKNGGFENDPDPKFIFRSIISIQQGNYSTNVKKWAALLIDKLRQY